MAAQTITISQEQQEELRNALRAAPMGAQDTFCNNWQSAKTALDMLKNLLVLVPGVGIFAGPAIGVVIAAGDAAFSAVCKK